MKIPRTILLITLMIYSTFHTSLTNSSKSTDYKTITRKSTSSDNLLRINRFNSQTYIPKQYEIIHRADFDINKDSIKDVIVI